MKGTCKTCYYYGLSRYNYVCCKKKDILVMPDSVEDCWKKKGKPSVGRWDNRGI